MNDTRGVLRPAVEAYLAGQEMTGNQISAMRAYLRQWMAADWMGPDVQALRDGVDSLVSKSAIDAWMELALKRGIDPL